MHYRTPKKPVEPRHLLAAEIMRQQVRLKLADIELIAYLMTFFTDVDLKLILEEMRSRT